MVKLLFIIIGILLIYYLGFLMYLYLKRSGKKLPKKEKAEIKTTSPINVVKINAVKINSTNFDNITNKGIFKPDKIESEKEAEESIDLIIEHSVGETNVIDLNDNEELETLMQMEQALKGFNTYKEPENKIQEESSIEDIDAELQDYLKNDFLKSFTDSK